MSRDHDNVLKFWAGLFVVATLFLILSVWLWLAR
jgi:hypothetical protein